MVGLVLLVIEGGVVAGVDGGSGIAEQALVLLLVGHIGHLYCDHVLIPGVLVVVVKVALDVLEELHPGGEVVGEGHQEEEEDADADAHHGQHVDVGEVAVAGGGHQGVQFGCEEGALGPVDEGDERGQVAQEQLLGLVVHEIGHRGVEVEVASFVGGKVGVIEVVGYEGVNVRAKCVQSVEVGLVDCEIGSAVIGGKGGLSVIDGGCAGTSEKDAGGCSCGLDRGKCT